MRGRKRANPAAVLVLAVALLLLGSAAALALQPAGLAFRVSSAGPDGDAGRDALSAQVAFNPAASEYLVVWEDDGAGDDEEFEIFGQRLSAGGAEIGGDFRIANTGVDGDDREAEAPAVTYNPTANEYLVVWEGDPLISGESEIFGQRLSAGGAEVGGDFRISNAGVDGDNFDAFGAAVTYNSTANEYLVAWEADNLVFDEFEIFGQRLNAGGAEIGGDFRISDTGPAGGDAFEPALTYNPSSNEYLVAWAADSLVGVDNEFEIFGQRLNAGGAEIGGDFRISNTGADDDGRVAEEPALAYNPTANEYLVAWDADGLEGNELEIFGQRLNAAAGEIGGDFRISNSDIVREAIEPALTYNPTVNEYLVAWEADPLASADNEFEIFGQRLSAGAAEIEEDFQISRSGGDADGREAVEPALIFNPMANEYLVTWDADGLATDDEFEIFGQRVQAPPAPPRPPAQPAKPAQPTKCAGKNATRTGTPGPDVIAGTAKRDVIASLGGNDKIRGLAGNDLICAGPGKDKILAGKGNDVANGEAGADTIKGGPGKDVLKGGPGKDKLTGGPGKDRELK